MYYSLVSLIKNIVARSSDETPGANVDPTKVGRLVKQKIGKNSLKSKKNTSKRGGVG